LTTASASFSSPKEADGNSKAANAATPISRNMILRFSLSAVDRSDITLAFFYWGNGNDIHSWFLKK
jgi:hypothetical protein